MINFLPGDAPADHQRAARFAGARRHPLHRQHRRLQQHVEEGRREHRPLPIVSAPGRRDRRQGLHRRAPVGGSAGSGGGDRARRVRVSGAEVLGREPRLRPAVALERSPRSHRRDDERDQDGRRRATSATSWARSSTRRRSTRSASTSTTRRRTRKILQGGAAKGETGYFIEPTLVETDRSRLPAAVRGDLRTGRDRVRLSGRASGRTRWRSSIGRRRTR